MLVKQHFTNSDGPAPAGNIAFNVNTLRANVNPDGTPMEHGYVFVASASEARDSTAGPAGTVTISGPGPESTDAARLVALNNFAVNTSVSGGTASHGAGSDHDHGRHPGLQR